eukprot:6470315-Amphidinium_carterae.1
MGTMNCSSLSRRHWYQCLPHGPGCRMMPSDSPRPMSGLLSASFSCRCHATVVVINRFIHALMLMLVVRMLLSPSLVESACTAAADMGHDPFKGLGRIDTLWVRICAA